MGRKQSVTLENGKHFTTKTAAIDYFKDILNTVRFETLLNSDHQSFSDLISLYKRHPEFELKSEYEANIVGFIVKNSGQFNTKCFHTVHRDNSLADWRYKSAIDGEHKTIFNCFVDAARFSLEVKHFHFRDKDFTNKSKAFLNLFEIDESSIPENWISQPNKLQYRSSLMEPIKTKFVSWYEDNYMPIE
jgi:hypothetical protein